MTVVQVWYNNILHWTKINYIYYLGLNQKQNKSLKNPDVSLRYNPYKVVQTPKKVIKIPEGKSIELKFLSQIKNGNAQMSQSGVQTSIQKRQVSGASFLKCQRSNFIDTFESQSINNS